MCGICDLYADGFPVIQTENGSCIKVGHKRCAQECALQAERTDRAYLHGIHAQSHGNASCSLKLHVRVV